MKVNPKLKRNRTPQKKGHAPHRALGEWNNENERSYNKVLIIISSPWRLDSVKLENTQLGPKFHAAGGGDLPLILQRVLNDLNDLKRDSLEKHMYVHLSLSFYLMY